MADPLSLRAALTGAGALGLGTALTKADQRCRRIREKWKERGLL